MNRAQILVILEVFRKFTEYLMEDFTYFSEEELVQSFDTFVTDFSEGNTKHYLELIDEEFYDRAEPTKEELADYVYIRKILTKGV